jgi:hypothetical protein
MVFYDFDSICEGQIHLEPIHERFRTKIPVN